MDVPWRAHSLFAKNAEFALHPLGIITFLLSRAPCMFWPKVERKGWKNQTKLVSAAWAPILDKGTGVPPHTNTHIGAHTDTQLILSYSLGLYGCSCLLHFCGPFFFKAFYFVLGYNLLIILSWFQVIWNILKLFIEFVTIALLLYVLVFWPRGMRES